MRGTRHPASHRYLPDLQRLETAKHKQRYLWFKCYPSVKHIPLAHDILLIHEARSTANQGCQVSDVPLPLHF